MRNLRRFLARLWERFLESGKRDMSKEEVAVVIENFVEGKSKDPEWDDFLSISQKDPYLDRVRDICDSVHYDYPSGKEIGYCSEQGYEVMRNLVKELRQGDPG